MPMPPILPSINWKTIFESAMTYSQWFEDGEMIEHQQRMEALRTSLPLSKEAEAILQALDRTVHVIAIAEDWCGDVVRHVPVLERLAACSPMIQVRYLKRTTYPDLFARYLTNGGEAIPRFIFLSEPFYECGNWGPMPAACRELIARGKACGDIGKARRKVSALYDADPDKQIVVQELMHLIEIASCREP